jgi:Restriction endonuclease
VSPDQPSSPPDKAQVASLVKWGKEVTRLVQPHTIDAARVHQQYEAQSNNREFDHELVALCDSRLVLIGETNTQKFSDSPYPFLWFWENRLCPMWSLSIFNWERNKTWRAFVVNDSAEFDLLRSKPVQVLLLRRDACVAALEVDLASANLELWREHMTRASKPYQHLHDTPGGKIYAEANATRPHSLEEHLRNGWAMRLNEEAGRVLRFLNDPDVSGFEEEKAGPLSRTRSATSFAEDNWPAKLYGFYHDRFWTHGDDPVVHSIRLTEDLRECPHHLSATRQLLECAWFSATGTLGGQRIQSVDLDGSIRPVPLDAQQLAEKCKVFWERLPFTLPLYYREVIGSGNCSLDVRSFVRSAPLYEGNVKEGEEFVNNLFAEASSLKQWTIPFGAYVLLRAGEIEAAKLYEVGSDIAVLLVDRRGDYFLVWINPAQKDFTFVSGNDLPFILSSLSVIPLKHESETQPTHDEIRDAAEDFKARFELGIRILLASIVRDFWVVEERERVFGASIELKKSPRLRADRGRPRVVYLPRIRYISDFKDRPDGLNLRARAPHFVVGHLRKAVYASQDQILLARSHGIIVPEGFTFVRPHRRGDAAQERIYRSRSALQCLRALQPASTSTRDSWFTFELRVREWLASNGFQVDHLAANRNGDGGVDIQASKGGEHLLVQCKYWHAHNVGPNIIREMLGTLQTFPPGSKGVIVASSELTSAAKELAVQHGIQFIERANFAEGIHREI